MHLNPSERPIRRPEKRKGTGKGRKRRAHLFFSPSFVLLQLNGDTAIVEASDKGHVSDHARLAGLGWRRVEGRREGSGGKGGRRQRKEKEEERWTS